MPCMEHHYVPQFYLKVLRDPACPEGHEPWLWVVDNTGRCNLINLIMRFRSPCPAVLDALPLFVRKLRSRSSPGIFDRRPPARHVCDGN